MLICWHQAFIFELELNAISIQLSFELPVSIYELQALSFDLPAFSYELQFRASNGWSKLQLSSMKLQESIFKLRASSFQINDQTLIFVLCTSSLKLRALNFQYWVVFQTLSFLILELTCWHQALNVELDYKAPSFVLQVLSFEVPVPIDIWTSNVDL